MGTRFRKGVPQPVQTIVRQRWAKPFFHTQSPALSRSGGVPLFRLLHLWFFALHMLASRKWVARFWAGSVSYMPSTISTQDRIISTNYPESNHNAFQSVLILHTLQSTGHTHESLGKYIHLNQG